MPTLLETDVHIEHLHTSVRETPVPRYHASLDFADVRTTSLAADVHPTHTDTAPSHRRSTDDTPPHHEGETTADERMMVLPWPLGERLLALLTNRPAQRPMDGSVSGSEPLPPYEEHDARRA
ncbi:hypothetical protein TRAPUB_11473 [Trametes pubescens]|uniref:Uncharacterized protein n=1 Tax=Trametes pubescens TaxID=154538 RepID=A0A1M2VWM3_TRAPU|nr:hypothetical protein TRAPUB_11473 [Trametes pubescens]